MYNLEGYACTTAAIAYAEAAIVQDRDMHCGEKRSA